MNTDSNPISNLKKKTLYINIRKLLNRLLIILILTDLIFEAFDNYVHFSNYDRNFMFVFLLVLSLSIFIFIFAPVTNYKSWPLYFRIPLVLVTAVSALTAAGKLNPCANGCDDDPIYIANLTWLIGFAFLHRRNLSWKYWLYLWSFINVFSVYALSDFQYWDKDENTDTTILYARIEFYGSIMMMIIIASSLYIPKSLQNRFLQVFLRKNKFLLHKLDESCYYIKL